MVGGGVPSAPSKRRAGTARPTIKLCGYKSGRVAAEHTCVALAKPLPPLGVYKNGAQGLRPV